MMAQHKLIHLINCRNNEYRKIISKNLLLENTLALDLSNISKTVLCRCINVTITPPKKGHGWFWFLEWPGLTLCSHVIQ